MKTALCHGKKLQRWNNVSSTHNLFVTDCTDGRPISGEKDIVGKIVMATLWRRAFNLALEKKESTDREKGGGREKKKKKKKKTQWTRTEHTKHSLCHFAPIALIATSGIGRVQALHLGLCSLKWHRSQYGWPLWITNSFVSPSSSWPSEPPPCLPFSVPGADDLEGSKKGSPHSEQKKCNSW